MYTPVRYARLFIPLMAILLLVLGAYAPSGELALSDAVNTVDATDATGVPGSGIVVFNGVKSSETRPKPYRERYRTMQNNIEDVPVVPAIRGRISREWRHIWHHRKGRANEQAGARRRNRRAYRQALLTGDMQHLPRPFGSYEIV